MKEDKEKKAAAMLDGSEPQEEEKKPDETEKKVIDDPGEMLRELCRGRIKLMYPFRAHSQDITEISYDFCSLTGEEMMDALDSVPTNNLLAISNKQAIALFATTAEKQAPMIQDGGHMIRLYDAKDVKKGLMAADSVKAVQLAKLFFNASSQAGNKNISKE